MINLNFLTSTLCVRNTIKWRTLNWKHNKNHFLYILFRCCVNDRCYKRKLKDDRCSSCGVFYKNQSSGEAFIAQLLLKCTESATIKTYTVFTQQLEQLTTATNVSLKSKSLETDIAKKFPITVKYQSLNEKLTKIAVQK